MNRLSISWMNIAAFNLILLFLSGCAPVTLKTVDLQPLIATTGTTVNSGSFGFCSGEGKTPSTTFSAPAETVMVGYDDFFRAGKPPFACDDVRVSVFRGGVKFDVSQFDAIASAEFWLDTTKSISRSDGKLMETSTPISYANRLCMGTEIFSSKMLCDYSMLLPVGETISVVVSDQVRDWISMRRNNFGFVLTGPRSEFSAQTPPRDNDAKISWYSNFRLRITYEPALNFRMAQ